MLNGLSHVPIAAVLAGLCVAHPGAVHAQEPPSERAKVVARYLWEPSGLIAEPDPIERAAIFGDRHLGGRPIVNGFYVSWGDMIPGSGWIDLGPGYRHFYAEDRMFLDASASLSWRGYTMARARFELPRLARSRITLGSAVSWQDAKQVAFFGEGPASLHSNLSEFRLQSLDLAGYATFRPTPSIAVEAQAGWLRPSVLAPAGVFQRHRPSTRDVFPGDVVFSVGSQPSFLHTEAGVRWDTRDYPDHPTDGGLLRAAAARYADRDGGVFTFRRFEVEGARFVPLADSRVVLAVHGWVVASDADEGRAVPFYLQPALGGSNSLRSYADYRFHDRQLLLLNAEARVKLMTHVDAAVFVDAGNVAGRVRDLDLSKRSYGAGLRLHSRRATFGRVDVAHGGEGWRVLFRLNDPLALARVGRRGATPPFTP
jgi:hypothetical protein